MYIIRIIPRIFLSIFNHRIPSNHHIRPQSITLAFYTSLSKILHSAIMFRSVELTNAYQELFDLFVDKFDATTDEERQDLEDQMDLQKARVEASEDLQQELMRHRHSDRPEGGGAGSIATLWLLLVDATEIWKNPSAEERLVAISKLDVLRYIFRRNGHRVRYM